MLLFSFITFGFVFIKNRESRLIEIASNYKTYSQDINVRAVVTDSSKYKWTIALCTYMGEDVMGYHQDQNEINH